MGEFLAEARRDLASTEGSEDDQYLFPAANGGAMSCDAFREMVGNALQRHAGLDITPRLIRPIIAKVVLERAPSLLQDVYIMFGVKPDDISYSIRRPVTEDACERVNRVLDGLRPVLGCGRRLDRRAWSRRWAY